MVRSKMELQRAALMEQRTSLALVVRRTRLAMAPALVVRSCRQVLKAQPEQLKRSLLAGPKVDPSCRRGPNRQWTLGCRPD